MPGTANVFAEVLLPVPVGRLFTYAVPEQFCNTVKPLQRVIVPFGERKILTGIIMRLHHQPPDFETKHLLELLDEEPCLTQQQVRFMEWMASYYLCTAGEVLQAALPAALKLSSESKVQIHPAFDWENTLFEFSAREEEVIRALQHGPLSYTDVARIGKTKNVYTLLKSLVRKQAVVLLEEVNPRYKPRTDRKIRLRAPWLTPGKLEELFSGLKHKPRQEEVLLKFLQELPVMHNPSINARGLSRSKLLEDGVSESALRTLIKNGVFEEFTVAVARFDYSEGNPDNLPQLSAEQQNCLNSILAAFSQKQAVLLHGVTGSGKTEIYAHLISKTLESGSQILYLLPEIALTTHMVERLRRVFGSSMAVYHSRFSDNERAEIWNDVLQGKVSFVLGVRSAVFLPFSHIGLIIVDEEHDASYKQQDPAPRYHARDAALMLGRIHRAPVLLGSATPSVESYYLANSGVFGYARLSQRYGEAQLPEIVLVDLKQERKLKRMKGMFSATLLGAINEALSRNEQVIVFQNRRGYAPLLSCEDCGYIPHCLNCAVSLTYHQKQNSLDCHYCGYRIQVPSVCPDCGSGRLKALGYGTEKLEEELRIHFPEATIDRMDLDTTRSKNAFEQLFNRFAAGTTNILVGTQMVTKGLDFERVSVAAVFYADRLLHFPDFRSEERAYQLLMQVSGRAGRKGRPGRVIIQTNRPEEPVFCFVKQNNDQAFYEKEIPDRQAHHYPPFTRLIEITVKHPDKPTARQAAANLFNRLRQQLPDLIIAGPGEPVIPFIRNLHLMRMLIKIPRHSKNLQQLKSTIALLCNNMVHGKAFRNLNVVIDVDPL
ncbi:MAG: primosomal protein N' [Cyclobacteriaceae bacterium]|nr:MAG: primosomal protein N' [Cyclobacteriaceae bacterium]